MDGTRILKKKGRTKGGKISLFLTTLLLLLLEWGGGSKTKKVRWCVMVCHSVKRSCLSAVTVKENPGDIFNLVTPEISDVLEK